MDRVQERGGDGFELPPMDVDHVADGLEDVERQPDGQGHGEDPRRRIPTEAPGQIAEAVNEEVEVLELDEDQEHAETMAVPVIHQRVRSSSTTANRRPAP